MDRFMTGAVILVFFTTAFDCVIGQTIDAEVEGSTSAFGAGEYARVRQLLSRQRGIGQPAPGVATGPPLGADFDDGTELTVNNKLILNDVYETDIVLTYEQALTVLGGGRRRRKRKVTNVARYHWPSRTIAYEWGLSDGTWQSQVRAGMQEWEKHTCLRFQYNPSARDKIRYIRGSGCYSSIGRVSGTQAISIGYGCESVGIVAHEIGHAMGFWHEQSRPDRNNYITIISANIIVGYESQFAMRTWSEINTHGGGYDLGSVMHYGPTAFTSGGKTIQTRDSSYSNTIGQRAGLSFIDVKQANNKYCSNVCGTSLRCSYGGYADPNDCSKCKCPTGLGGTTCNGVQTSSRGCGGELQATSNWLSISAPTIAPGQSCYWKITSPAGTRVMLQLNSLNYPCVVTCTGYVEVKSDSSDFESTGSRFCCSPPSVIYARDNVMFVLHYAHKGMSSNWRGFSGYYKYYGTPTGTTTTTTARPTVGTWSAWGSWSQCTRTCGNCGTKQRRRTCSGGTSCSGTSVSTASCPSTACTRTTSGGGGGSSTKIEYCTGKVYARCDLVDRLRFDFSQGSFEPSFISQMFFGAAIEYDPDDAVNPTNPIAFDAGLCPKTFAYPCTKSSGGTEQFCCTGQLSSGRCV